MGNRLESCCAERSRNPSVMAGRTSSGSVAAPASSSNAGSAARFAASAGAARGTTTSSYFRPTIEYRRQNYLDVFDGSRSGGSRGIGRIGNSGASAAPQHTPEKDAPRTVSAPTPETVGTVRSHESGDGFNHRRSISPSSVVSEASNISRADSIVSLRDVAPPDPNTSDDELEEEGFLQALTAQGSIMKSVACFKQQLYVQSKMHLKRAVQYAMAGEKNRTNLLSLARAYGNLANVYEFLMNSEKAAVYHIACINLLRELGETERESVALSNALVTYIKLGRHKYALLLARRRLAVAETEEAKIEARVWCKRIQRCIDEDDTVRMNVDAPLSNE